MKNFRMLFGAVVAVTMAAGGGNAATTTTLNFYDDGPTQTNLRFTLECTLGCEAWDDTDFSTPNGDLFSLANNSEALEIATVNSLTGESYTSLNKIDTGGADDKMFTTSAEYFLIKIGKDPNVTVVKNLGENNKYTFAAVSGTGSGLSHYSEFGTTTPIPLPAAGWMLMAGLGGLAAMRRRKKS